MWVSLPIFGPIILLFLSKPCGSVKGCTVILRNQKSTLKKAVCTMPNAILKTIPLDLPETLAELEISFQNLQIIQNKEFIHLPNLEFLSITSSNIETIQVGAFIQLSKLQKLILTNNSLIVSSRNQLALSANIFLPLLSLKTLDLSQNHIGDIPDFFFNHVNKTLEHLQLSHSKTEITLTKNSLMHLGVLKSLNLKLSKITTLSSDLEESFNFMVNLKEFLLFGNLWHCDCQLKWFIVWMLERFYYRNRIHSKRENLICASPPVMANQSLYIIGERGFQCIPEPVTLNSTVSTFAGRNISLSCIFKNLNSDQNILWKNNELIFTNQIHNKRFSIVETRGKYRKSILKIINVSKLDEGVWKCFVNQNDQPIEIEFMLTVEMDYFINDPLFNSKLKYSPKNSTVYALVSTILVVLFIIIIIIVALYYFKYYKGNMLTVKNRSYFNVFAKKPSTNNFYKIGKKNVCPKLLNHFSMSNDSVKLEEKIYDSVPISSGFYINFSKQKNEQNFSTLNCMDCQNFAIVDESKSNNVTSFPPGKSKSPRFWYLDDSIDGIDYLPTAVALTKDINITEISEGDSAFITRVPSRIPCPIHSSQASIRNFKKSISDLSEKKLHQMEDLESCPIHGKRSMQNSHSVHFSIPDHQLNKSSTSTLYSGKSPRKTTDSLPKSCDKSKLHNYFPVYLSSLDMQQNEENQSRKYSCLTNSVV